MKRLPLIIAFTVVAAGLVISGCGESGSDEPGSSGAVNECATENGGCGQVCNDTPHSYECSCEEGYTLADDWMDCENIDDCAIGPCENGGICTDGIMSYTCECPEGFEGENCEKNIDDCEADACLNGGTCIDGVNSYTCDCEEGFSGENCEDNIDDCVPNPCLNGGTCIDGVASHTCSCPPGFTGANCEFDINDCVPNPCLNGGTCNDGVNSYTCNCLPDFGGPDCAQCASLKLTKSGPVTTIPTAGVRVVFSVETCDGGPVPDLLANGSIEVINNETGKPFGSEGDAAPSVGEAKDFAFYTIVVLDLSYSVVNNGSLESEIDGAISLVQQLVEEPQDVRQKHNVALYVFGSTSESELSQDFTKNHTLLYQKLDALKSDPGKGSTNLYGAYKTSLSLVENEKWVPDEEMVMRSMVLMSDGTHETGDAFTEGNEAKSALNVTPASVYIIGLAGDYDQEKLEELATGPDYFLLAADTNALVEAFGEIAAQLDAWAKSNYVVGVCSPVEGPNRSLTLNATYDTWMYGSISANYDATGFNLVGCDPSYVADPCSFVECGVIEGIQCSSCQSGMVCIQNTCGN